jgi:predicted secreted Zn-dependent protease
MLNAISTRLIRGLCTSLAAILVGCAAVGGTATATPTRHAPPASPLPASTATRSPSPTATFTPTPSPSATTTPSPTLTATVSPAPTYEFMGSSVTEETRGAVTLVLITNLVNYEITGETADEIDAQMRARGPNDPLAGFGWYALTEPLFDWQCHCSCTETGCVTGPVRVLLTLTYTFPRWLPPAGADEALRLRWATFEAALLEHERGHGALAIECAWQLGEAFAALPPVASCAELDRAVLAASQPVFAACRDAQSQYETETGHGQTQGVIWPP